MVTDSDGLVLYAKKGKCFRYSLMSFALLLGTSILWPPALFALHQQPLLWRLLLGIPLIGVGLFVGLSCVAAGLFLLQRSRSSEPLLVVDGDGVFDNASVFAVGLIRWREIETIHIANLDSMDYLAITPTEVWSIPSGFPGWKRLIKEIHLRVVAHKILIPLFFVKDVPDDLLSRVEAIRQMGQ